MRTIIETLQANVPTVYGLAGSRLEILECVYPVSVSLQGENGVELTNGRADSVEAGTYFQPARGFKRFVITSAQAQEITVGVSYGDSGTRRVAGVVTISNEPGVNVVNTPSVNVANIPHVIVDSTFDPRADRAKNSQSFHQYFTRTGAAGTYPHILFWNPAESGKRVIVQSLTAQNNGSLGAVYARKMQATMGTFSARGGSKNLSNVTSLAELWGFDNATIQGTSISLQYMGNTPMEFVKGDPFVITPGNGLVMVASDAAARLAGEIDWYEEAI